MDALRSQTSKTGTIGVTRHVTVDKSHRVDNFAYERRKRQMKVGKAGHTVVGNSSNPFGSRVSKFLIWRG